MGARLPRYDWTDADLAQAGLIAKPFEQELLKLAQQFRPSGRAQRRQPRVLAIKEAQFGRVNAIVCAMIFLLWAVQAPCAP